MQSTIILEFEKDNSTFIDTLQNRQPSTNENIKTLEVKKFSSLKEIEKFIASSQIRAALSLYFPQLYSLKLINDNHFDLENSIQFRSQEFDDKNKFLLSIESSDGSHMILYWKNLKNEEFYQLNLNTDVPKIVKNFIFECIFKILQDKEGAVTSYSTSGLSLSTLTSTEWSNLLVEAILEGNLQIIKELLKFPFDVNEEFLMNDEESKEPQSFYLIDVVFKAKRFDIMLELLKKNSIYPKEYKKMKEKERPREIEDFLQISKNLFIAIKNDERTKVDEILKNNSNLRYFFNENNLSAATIAIRNRKIEIYKILLAQNLCFGAHEIVANINDQNFLEIIRNLHSESSLNFPDYHILILISKSVIFHSNSNIFESFKIVKETFEFLNKIPEVKPVLHILALDKKTKFHFDFNKTSIAHMNLAFPDRKFREFIRETRGVFHSLSHHIYIGAKNLFDERTKAITRASIAHEFYHCGFHLIFMNNRLPFAINDESNKAKFFEILDECEKLKDKEEIIKAVFSYYEDSDKENTKLKRARELAVRVPHMMTEYFDDKEKIKDLKIIFKKLFDYHYQIVMPEFQNALPLFENLANTEILINFKNLTVPLKAAIFYSNVNFQGKQIKLNEIADEKILENLKSEQIRDILNRKIITIGKEPIKLNENYIERDFIDYNFDSKITEINLATGELELTGECKENFKNFNLIIEEVKESKIFLLADHSGAGKSLTMKKSCIEIKEKFKNYFVSFVDLKQHLEIFEKFKNIEGLSEISLLEEILNEILKPSDDFELSILNRLFKSDQMILFFDALDEIAPKYEEFFLKLIKSIKNLTKNQQWIATRPQHIEKLKTEFDQKAYKLLPLDEAKTKKFIQNFAETQNVDQNLFGKIKDITGNINLIDNPLMLKMIVKLHMTGELKTTNFNRFSLYDAMFNTKREILTDKGKVANFDATIESNLTLWKVHQVYAIQTIFPNEKFENFLQKLPKAANNSKKRRKLSKFVNFEDFELLRQWKNDKSNWTADAIARCGFLTVHNWNNENEYPEFVHRTFAEYFVTKFIINSVKEAIKSHKFTEEFDMTIKFTAFLIDGFCKISNNDDGIYGFILDYLTLNDLNEIKIGKQFLKLLLTKEVKNFIIKILNYNFWYSKQNIAKIVVNLLKLPQINNFKFINQLTLIENGHSKMFQIIFKNQNSAIEVVEIFKILKSTNLPNWHQLTGYGKNIEELRIENFEIIQIESQNEEIKLIYQLLWLLANANEISMNELEQFLSSFIQKFSFSILKSQSLILKFFEILQKYFKESKEIFDNFFFKFLDGFFSDIKKLMNFNENQQIIENLNKFLNLLENFFNSDPKYENEVTEKISKIFESSKSQLNCFQILFNFCGNFDKIFESIEILKMKFKNDWPKHTGYNQNHENISDSRQIKEHKVNDLRAILNLEIPFSHFESFYENHLYNIFKLSIMYDEISLTENIFKIQEKNNSKKLNFALHCAFLKILWIDDKYKDRNKKTFETLISMTTEVLRICDKFLIFKDNNLYKYHPLFQAISYDNEIELNIYKKKFSSEEILKIIFEHFSTFVLLEKPEKFKDFLNEVFDANLNGNFLEKFTWTESNEYFHSDEVYKLHSQNCFYFFNLISRIDCSNLLNDLENFFYNHLFFALFYAFLCRPIIDKFFEILEKYFNDEKLKVSKVMQKSLDETCFFEPGYIYGRDDFAACKSNIEYFWRKFEKFFNSNRELICEILMSDYEFKNPLVIGIYYEINENFLKEFCFKYIESNEIFKNIVLNIRSISIFFDEEFFDKFIYENFMTNIERKNELKNFFEIISNDDEKIFLKQIEDKLRKIKGDRFISYKTKTENSLKFLNFLFKLSESLNVSLFKSFCFSKIEKNSLKFFNSTEEFFNYAFQNDVKDLNEILDIKFYDEQKIIPATSLKFFAFDVFYQKLQNNSIKNSLDWIRKFLLIECETNQIHPLIVALCYNYSHVVKLYKKHLSNEENLKILLNHLTEIRLFSISSKEIFMNFFTFVFNENFIDETKIEFLYPANNEKVYERFSNHSQILFYFLNSISSCDCSNVLNNIENFFHNQFWSVLFDGFCFRSIFDEIFKILEKYFKNKKVKVVEWIKKAFDLTTFFNPNDRQNIAACQSNIELFWNKFENFFNSNCDFMKEILLSDYKFCHPLVICIYYDMNFLKKIYSKYCNTNEILKIFHSNFNSIARFYDERNFEKFIVENFLSNEEDRNNFIVFLYENSIFDKIKNEDGKIIDDNFVKKEKKIENLRKFSKMLKRLRAENMDTI
ncbi:hypothetical protein PVAND_017273 [Polypedilum vanderplanki]|uniref:RGS domain-containing protein n=1 Tax=Polypedilum vanderplanki TaxID=319348 RepID=A0A9J6BI49_POLVA|nr:hypothetical protein PVAND_017273 [Polypedilum vanderplanki]